MAQTGSGKPVQLFATKHGVVNATIFGPTVGFLWTKVEYFRWVQSTKEAGKWEKRFPDREADQVHLEKCVKEVRGWFRQNRE